MKFSILSLTLFTFLFTATAFGQDSTFGDIPSVVKNNFSSAYPQAADVEWKQENDLYHVEFETGDDIDHDIWYDASSNIVRQKDEITEQDLPAAIMSAIRTDFDGYDIDDVDKITTPEGESYEVELDSLMKQELKVTFSADGTVLSQKED